MDGKSADQRFVEAFGLILEGNSIEHQAFGAPPSARLEAVHKAVKKYTQAIRLNPDNSKAYVSRCSAYGFLARHTSGTLIPRELFWKAQSDARRAVALKHKDPADYLVIARALPGLEKKAILRHAMDLSGLEEPTYYYLLGLNLAHCFWYEGDFEGFTREVRSLIEKGETRLKKPNLYPCYMALGQGLEALDRYAEAAAVYREVFDGEPTVFSGVCILKAAIRGGDLDSAGRFLSESGHLMPENVVRIWRDFLTLLKGKQLDESALQRFLTDLEQLRDPFVAGIVCAYSGAFSKANDLLSRVVRIAEGNPLEWGVTYRWEVNKARGLLQVLATLLKSPGLN